MFSCDSNGSLASWFFSGRTSWGEFLSYTLLDRSTIFSAFLVIQNLFLADSEPSCLTVSSWVPSTSISVDLSHYFIIYSSFALQLAIFLHGLDLHNCPRLGKLATFSSIAGYLKFTTNCRSTVFHLHSPGLPFFETKRRAEGHVHGRIYTLFCILDLQWVFKHSCLMCSVCI